MMTYPLPLKVLGVGHYLPERIVHNSELEQSCGLESGWIESKQGIKQRHRVVDQTASEMGASAAREALENAGLRPEDLDLILNASGSQEQAIPDGAPLIQRHLGLGGSGIACHSVHSTCLSFLTAFDMSASLLTTGRYQRILIVSADITSKAVNWKDPESSTLFGDGAAAVVVGRTPLGEKSAVHVALFETYSKGSEYAQVVGGGTRKHPNSIQTVPEDNLFYMDGPAVVKMVFRYSPRFLRRLKRVNPEDDARYDLVIPHQASKLALDSHSKFGFKDDCVVRTLDRFGNCIAASMPLTLHYAIQSGRLKRGDRALLLGTGAGLSFGGLVFTY
jgi:3-oxoacyl-[acyl-carrier-protein] synthase-3